MPQECPWMSGLGDRVQLLKEQCDRWVIVGLNILSKDDFVYCFWLGMQFRLAYKDKVTGELVDDPKLIAIKYLRGFFVVDVVTVLPLPQVKRYCLQLLTSTTLLFGIAMSCFAQFWSSPIPLIFSVHLYYLFLRRHLTGHPVKWSPYVGRREKTSSVGRVGSM